MLKYTTIFLWQMLFTNTLGRNFNCIYMLWKPAKCEPAKRESSEKYLKNWSTPLDYFWPNDSSHIDIWPIFTAFLNATTVSRKTICKMTNWQKWLENLKWMIWLLWVSRMITFGHFDALQSAIIAFVEWQITQNIRPLSFGILTFGN